MFNLYVFVYFFTSFFFQEKLWFIVVSNDFLPITQGDLFDWDFLLLYLPIISYVALWWLPTKADELKTLCLSSYKCKRHLGSTGNPIIVGSDVVDRGDSQ